MHKTYKSILLIHIIWWSQSNNINQFIKVDESKIRIICENSWWNSVEIKKTWLFKGKQIV